MCVTSGLYHARGTLKFAYDCRFVPSYSFFARLARIRGALNSGRSPISLAPPRAVPAPLPLTGGVGTSPALLETGKWLWVFNTHLLPGIKGSLFHFGVPLLLPFSFLLALLLPVSDALLVPPLPLFLLGNNSGFMCGFSRGLSKNNYAPLTPLCIITNSHL